MPLRLELIEVDNGSFTVIVGSEFADHLCRDEALGVIAAALFGGHGPRMPYLKSYEAWAWWDRKYRRDGCDFKPAALLNWQGATVN